MPIKPVRRPPIRSASIPITGRNSEPPSSGMAVSSPCCVEESPSSSRRNGARGPSITHVMKLTSK